ncbi:DsbA family protein [Microbacterium paraoxydans]|uniref:DsbA family protein n=1 Tax=Microbacterium paraoxydans TaxID=199592 RepID=UPI0021A31B65|nr:DsbA family protein [Microbacterium paraoxydans]MCT2223183.1 DsbA family protein [Microbacterium paraoxydans]
MTDSARPSRNELESRLTFYKRLTIGLAILCAFLGLVVIAQLTNGGDAAAHPEPSGSASSSASEIASREEDDYAAVGDVDAPVALVQWTDMRCPYCAAVHRETLPTIIDEYVDKGLVRLEVRDVSFFGEQSENAAVAARAAGKQGKFFEYLDAVYEAAPENDHPDLPREKLLSFAEAAGVPDLAQFTADLDDPALHEAAQQSTTDAQRLGVNAVPFFVAGDTALSGAQPLSVFRGFLDQALEKAE